MERITTLYSDKGKTGDLWAVFHEVDGQAGMSWHFAHTANGDTLVWRGLRNVSSRSGVEMSEPVRVRDLT
jgi:hypothetical protein